jgi:hypothetical protein
VGVVGVKVGWIGVIVAVTTAWELVGVGFGGGGGDKGLKAATDATMTKHASVEQVRIVTDFLFLVTK